MTPRAYRTIAVVPAAGAGRRLGTKIRKPFVKICGKPLIAHTLLALQRAAGISGIVIATERASIRKMSSLVKKYGIKKVRGIVEGGVTRQVSVRNAVNSIKDKADLVLVHDAARPCVEGATIAAVIAAAIKYGAAIVAAPSYDTVKEADREGFIVRTLDRSILWRAETPQVFKSELLKRLYRDPGLLTGTDDAALFEKAGLPVRIVEGPRTNIKVTTRDDILIAEALLCR